MFYFHTNLTQQEAGPVMARGDKQAKEPTRLWLQAAATQSRRVTTSRVELRRVELRRVQFVPSYDTLRRDITGRGAEVQSRHSKI